MPRSQVRYRRKHAPIGWPTILFVLVSLWLWSLWPRGAYAPHAARRLPEAGAAYVHIEGAEAPAFMKPDLFARPSRIGFGRLLPERAPETLPEPHSAAPPLFLDNEQARRTPRPSPSVPDALFPLERTRSARWIAATGAPRPAGVTTSAVHAVRSRSLEQAGFTFDMPGGVWTGSVWRLTLYIEPGLDTYTPIMVFVESEGLDDDSVRRWMHAALRGTATNEIVAGFVELAPSDAVIAR